MTAERALVGASPRGTIMLLWRWSVANDLGYAIKAFNIDSSFFLASKDLPNFGTNHPRHGGARVISRSITKINILIKCRCGILFAAGDLDHRTAPRVLEKAQKHHIAYHPRVITFSRGAKNGVSGPCALTHRLCGCGAGILHRFVSLP